jgi:hypothetical protein
MDVILRFLMNNEVWIYALLGIGAFIFLQRTYRTWREWRGTFFGLERELARQKFNIDVTGLIVVFFLAATVFGLVTFVAPSRPQVASLATPTIDFLATPTVTLPAGTRLPATPTGLALSAQTVVSEGCQAGRVDWTFPKNGGELKGTVILKGTVNVTNLGFYKYEFSPTGSTVWTTISAGNTNRTDSDLGGQWNTAQLVPGDYRLRLVVADNQNTLLPACVINIRIVSP